MTRTRQALAGVIVALAGTFIPFMPITSAMAQQPPTAATKPVPALEKLRGRWLRDAGGYIIEIRKVGPGGKLDAAYFNPKSINVGRAEAIQQSGAVKVTVELRDVNYPGSTYTLTYDAKTDRLVGRYYQAVAGETFDVYFVRLKT
jgi:hypothetical protein